MSFIQPYIKSYLYLAKDYFDYSHSDLISFFNMTIIMKPIFKNFTKEGTEKAIYLREFDVKYKALD